MNLKSWIKGTGLSIVLVLPMISASSAWANLGHGGWNGGRDASWDPRFDLPARTVPIPPRWGDFESDTRETEWDPFRRLGIEGTGWDPE